MVLVKTGFSTSLISALGFIYMYGFGLDSVVFWIQDFDKKNEVFSLVQRAGGFIILVWMCFE